MTSRPPVWLPEKQSSVRFETKTKFSNRTWTSGRIESSQRVLTNSLTFSFASHTKHSRLQAPNDLFTEASTCILIDFKGNQFRVSFQYSSAGLFRLWLMRVCSQLLDSTSTIISYIAASPSSLQLCFFLAILWEIKKKTNEFMITFVLWTTAHSRTSFFDLRVLWFVYFLFTVFSSFLVRS